MRITVGMQVELSENQEEVQPGHVRLENGQVVSQSVCGCFYKKDIEGRIIPAGLIKRIEDGQIVISYNSHNENYDPGDLYTYVLDKYLG